MIYNRFDVVAVDFPFVEGMESKKRPGLVVSTARLHDFHKLYWIAMISTAQAGERADDIMIGDLAKAGLEVPCAIRVARMAAVSEMRLQRRLGSLGSRDRNAVIGLMKKFSP